MVATTLTAGDIAIIGYNTGQNLSAPATEDKLYFVLLKAIGDGTTIFITDRTWTPSGGSGSFAGAGGGDGTFTYLNNTGNTLPAGTVISITQAQLTAAGIDINHTTGDTFYAYQGAINVPTHFLYAAEFADGNNTFNGSLTNTGLTDGTTAIAIAHDSGAYAGPTTHAGSFLHNGHASTLLHSIDDQNNWTGDDVDGVNASEQFVQTGPWLVHHDVEYYGVGNPGGSGIFNVVSDSTHSSGIDTFNYSLLYNNALVGGVTPLVFHPNDIVFDTVNGKYFIADSDITGGHNRILQGNISDLNGNPGTVPTLTVLFSDPAMTPDPARMDNLAIDTANQIVYFTHGGQVEKVNYNTANQTPTVLFDANIVGNPAGSTNNFFTDMEINFGTGHIYLLSARATVSLNGDNPSKNHLYDLIGLTTGSGTNAFTFAGGTAVHLPFNPDDNDAGSSPAPGEAFPEEDGLLAGIALDAVNNILYFSTGRLLYDHDANSGTPPTLTIGGIFSYALSGNPNGNYTQIYEPVDDGNDGSDAISEANGPQGLLDDLEINPVTGRWYVVDFTGDTNGGVQNAGDEGIWSGLLGGGGIQFVADINTVNQYALQGFTINNAPTMTGNGLAAAVTEASSAPASGETSKPLLFNSITIADPDTTTADEITGAVVRVSTNFLSDAMGLGEHQDYLRISNNLSGTIAGSGINYTYNINTGAMVLTGAATVAEYKAAIELVTFSTDGDNITNYGFAATRQVAASVSDGLTMSDEVLSAVITVTGINDAPVNTPGAAMNFTEDTTGHVGAEGVPPTAPRNAVTGISVFDVDADPATQDITVTLSVGVGTLTIRTDVTGGLAAGEVTGNGTGTLVLTGTQNQINTTLAAMSPSFTGPPIVAPAANGLIYTPPANYNGATTLVMNTNDGGFNGNDPGNSGTGTTEADGPDNKIINVADVNDAPTVGDGTEDSPAILEDTPYTNLNAPNVSTLFGGQFLDAVDDQDQGGANPTGSTGDTFAGIAIVSATSNANGAWQYWDGDSWENMGAGAQNAARTFAAGTLIRFNPVLNYNGLAPTLTAHLIESGGPAITDNGTVNLNPVGTATGGITVYSTNTVVLSQAITAVNDAPVNTVGASLDINEDAPVANVTGVSITDVEANPATDPVSVTLDVDHGTLAILTNVAGGITGANIISQDADTISIVATINQINATLAAAGGLTYDSDADYFGGDTLEVTTSDLGATGQDPVPGTGTGSDEQDVDSKVINIAAVDDLATTAADADDVDEDATVNINVIANDTDIDSAMQVAEIDGQAVAPGGTVTLASGAEVTLELDGTLTYDPNDVFNSLVEPGHGAVNETDTETFSYELSDGQTANVTVTVHGVLSPEDIYMGDGTDNTINGTAGTDFFYVMQAGTETLDGLGGNDAFLFGPYLDATDDVDGGPGTKDQLGIQGDYSGGLTLGANNLVNIETFVLLSGTDTRFGDSGLNLYDYDITTVDANVPNGGLLKVQANMLVAGEDVTFDGSDESNGAFFIYAGQGQDSWTGGDGDDAFFFGHDGSIGAFTAADSVNGGDGNNDQLGLRGDYTSLITFLGTTMQNVEVLVAISSTDARFGNTGSDFDYNLKTHNDNVAATETLSVTGAMLTATETLAFDGSLEIDGHFDIKGGKGDDVLIGGALADLLFGNEGQDDLTGGGGNDSFRYRSAADSAVGDEDVIADFTAGDKIDLSMMDANSTAAGNNAFTFSNDGTFHNLAGEVRAYESSPGLWFVEGDLDGGGTADFAIQVSLTNALAPLTAADFNL